MKISKSTIFSLWLVATLFLCTLTWVAVYMEFKMTATPMPTVIRQKNCTIVEDQNSVEFYQTKFRNGTCPTVPNGCFNRTSTQCLMLGTGNCTAREIWPPMWQKPCPIKPQCPIPRKQESIMRFRNAPLTSKTVFEWLNMYEPQSLERLEVVTTLLEKVLYPVLKWSSHQQMANNYNSYCTICKQKGTLDYINCVMGEHLLDKKNTNKIFVYPVKDITDENSLQHMQKEMEFIINTDPADNCNLDYLIFNKILKIKNMFSITTNSYKACQICPDYNKAAYDKCFVSSQYSGPCKI